MAALISVSGKADSSTGEVKLELFDGDNLWAAIGAAADQKRFEQRTLALTNPAKYENERNDMLKKLKNSTAETFKSTYAMYNTAGYAQSESRKLAIAASKATYDIGIRALRAQFPSATDNLFQGAATTHNVMMANAAASQRRRAPAKRKKPAQKRR